MEVNLTYGKNIIDSLGREVWAGRGAQGWIQGGGPAGGTCHCYDTEMYAQWCRRRGGMQRGQLPPPTLLDMIAS